MILFDSNIVIGYLNGDEKIVTTLDTLKQEREGVCISSISVAEALSLSSITDDKIQTIEQFLSGFIVIHPDMDIARTAARFRRINKLDLPDAFIAATARVHDIPLATRDKKMRTLPGIVFAEI
ncbi:MAG: PIN domain-containing protein [Patescibacteria group bacterium]